MKSFKKALAIFLATVMALGVMSVSVFAEGESVSGILVSEVDVTVEAPVADCYASGNYLIESEEYELIEMMWTDANTGDILYSTNADAEVADVTFTEGSVYTVSIALYAADGYVFELDSEALIVSINGYAAEVEEISELGKLLIVSCDFECEGEIVDGGDDTSGITFDQILDLLKTVLLTFVRFIGSLLGIK